MKKIMILFAFLVLISCEDKKELEFFKTYDESELLQKQQEHQIPRMKFKLFQSKVLNMNTIFKPFNDELATNFSEEEYNNLKPLILEQNIPSIQGSISKGLLSYEKLTLFYLYRIRKLESDSSTSLHAIIALNSTVLEEARARDKNRDTTNFLINVSMYGMPVLIKDNINTSGMPTTAGAIALLENENTEDAFIIKKLKEAGALILGKSNLSEWAYYFCGTCPVGYSATGGQTLNPYGRAIFESGGSSSGSGASVAANYAVAAVGTETSGSITSPSSQNSVVGLKPTIGLLSRTGIVPISTTLDTPGPMTKNVTDNYILLTAMQGYDASDSKSFEVGFVLYNRIIDNWILWAPNQLGIWTPQNLKAVQSKGIELKLNLEHKVKKLNISLNTISSINSSTNYEVVEGNENQIGKQLIYIPLINSKSNLAIKYGNAGFRYNYQFTDKRFYTTSNSLFLDSYHLHGASIIYHYKESMIAVSVNNIFNADFQEILNIPTPKINYSISITIKL